MTLLELNYQRRKTAAAANELLDNSILERRELTATERLKFDQLTARITELDSATAERESFRKAV